jgi:hypothetical protein
MHSSGPESQHPGEAKVPALACRTTLRGGCLLRGSLFRQSEHERMLNVSQKDPAPGEARRRLRRSEWAAYS